MTTPAQDNTGRLNLKRARFFLSRTAEGENEEPFDRFAVETHLSAAIVFGKATQDWMADTFREQVETSVPGAVRAAREKWLTTTALHDNPICKLFADARNVIVHGDGSVELLTRERVVFPIPTAAAVGSTPGQEREARRILADHEEQAREFARNNPIRRTFRPHFVNVYAEIAKSPAVYVVTSYLEILEQVLDAQQFQPFVTHP